MKFTPTIPCPSFQTLPWILGMALCLCITATQSLAQTGNIELYVADQTLSASIRNAPLQDVISRIEEELGIWVRGTHHVTEETVSVEFESMPIDKGLDRILSSTNYSLVFDDQGGILGVILIRSASTPSVRPTRRAVRPRTPPTLPQRRLPRPR